MPAINGPVAPKNIVKKLEKIPPKTMYFDFIEGIFPYTVHKIKEPTTI